MIPLNLCDSLFCVCLLWWHMLLRKKWLVMVNLAALIQNKYRWLKMTGISTCKSVFHRNFLFITMRTFVKNIMKNRLNHILHITSCKNIHKWCYLLSSGVWPLPSVSVFSCFSCKMSRFCDAPPLLRAGYLWLVTLTNTSTRSLFHKWVYLSKNMNI